MAQIDNRVIRVTGKYCYRDYVFVILRPGVMIYSPMVRNWEISQVASEHSDVRPLQPQVRTGPAFSDFFHLEI